MRKREETVKNKKPKAVWIIIAVTLALAVVIIAAIAVKTGSPEFRLKKQLEIADRYLSELKYEQAVAAYELAIEIDPMSVEAYLGLAEAYIGKGDQKAAREALKRGIERVSDERLIKKLADLYLDEANELVAVKLYESALELLRKGYEETNDQRIEDKIKEIEELLDEIENRKNERSESVELSDKAQDNSYIEVEGVAVLTETLTKDHDGFDERYEGWMTYCINFSKPVSVIVDGVNIELESAGLNYTTEDKVGVSSIYRGKIKKTPWQYYCPYEYYLEVDVSDQDRNTAGNPGGGSYGQDTDLREGQRSDSELELTNGGRSAQNVEEMVFEYYVNAYKDESLGYSNVVVWGDTLSMDIMKLFYVGTEVLEPYEWIEVEVDLKTGKMTGSDGLEAVLW